MKRPTKSSTKLRANRRKARRKIKNRQRRARAGA
jgi:hypothetical protein